MEASDRINVRPDDLGIDSIGKEVQSIDAADLHAVVIRAIIVVSPVERGVLQLKLHQRLALISNKVPGNLLRRHVEMQQTRGILLVASIFQALLSGGDGFHHEEQLVLAARQILVHGDPVLPALPVEVLLLDLELELDLFQLSDAPLQHLDHLRSAGQVAEVGCKHDLLEALAASLLKWFAVEQEVHDDDVKRKVLRRITDGAELRELEPNMIHAVFSLIVILGSPGVASRNIIVILETQRVVLVVAQTRRSPVHDSVKAVRVVFELEHDLERDPRRPAGASFDAVAIAGIHAQVLRGECLCAGHKHLQTVHGSGEPALHQTADLVVDSVLVHNLHNLQLHALGSDKHRRLGVLLAVQLNLRRNQAEVVGV